MHYIIFYYLAVHVIAFYGHAGLHVCLMTGKAQSIMADPYWPSIIHNGLVYLIMA